jgi:hypothetical protein
MAEHRPQGLSSESSDVAAQDPLLLLQMSD